MSEVMPLITDEEMYQSKNKTSGGFLDLEKVRKAQRDADLKVYQARLMKEAELLAEISKELLKFSVVISEFNNMLLDHREAESIVDSMDGLFDLCNVKDVLTKTEARIAQLRQEAGK